LKGVSLALKVWFYVFLKAKYVSTNKASIDKQLIHETL